MLITDISKVLVLLLYQKFFYQTHKEEKCVEIPGQHKQKLDAASYSFMILLKLYVNFGQIIADTFLGASETGRWGQRAGISNSAPSGEYNHCYNALQDMLRIAYM